MGNLRIGPAVAALRASHIPVTHNKSCVVHGMRKTLGILVSCLVCSVANAALVTVDFNDFDLSSPLYAPGYVPIRALHDYEDNGVTITSLAEYFQLGDTRYMRDGPDALLATPALNGSGLLSSSQRPFAVTTNGNTFTLASVDLLKGLNNDLNGPPMYVRLDAYLGGVLTNSIDVYFPPPDPANHAAWVGGQSWLFDFNGAALGPMDRLEFTGVGREFRRGFFMDDLVLDVLPASVPEPGTMGLLGLGLLAAGIAKRRGRVVT
jgi:hypothetical protein